MLVDKLRMTVAPEQQTEIVEPGDDALQLYPIYQKIVSAFGLRT